MSLTYREYSLNRTTVDENSGVVQSYMNELKVERSGVERTRLSVEEILLSLLDHYGEGIAISVGMGRQFGRHIIRLRYVGDPFDPSENSENPLSDEILRSLGLFPAWSYQGRVNTASMTISNRKRLGLGFFIIVAVLLAVLCGFAGNYLPDTLRQSINDHVLSPLNDGFLGLLRTFSGLMIAFTICNGIIGMRDTSTFRRIGRSVLQRIILNSFVICLIMIPLILPFVNPIYSHVYKGESSAIGQISKMFFDIIPQNIVEPFITGNSLQIILIAVIVGVGLISIGERGGHIQILVNEVTILMQGIVSSICVLVPLFIFTILLRQIWSGQIIGVLPFLKPIIMSLTLTIVLTAIIWLITAFRLKTSPISMLKKLLPPFLLALTTASSVTALPLAMETCEKKFGIRKSMISFIMPLGAVVYMPSSIMHLSIMAFTFAEIYKIDISLAWILMVIVVVPLNAIAMPPIPGVGPIIFTILFTSLGIPLEAIVVAVTMDLIFDFFDTGFNILHLMLFTACTGKELETGRG